MVIFRHGVEMKVEVNGMDRCLTYKIKNVEYLQSRGEGLADIIKGWLNTNGFDVIVYDFIIEEFANIIVDYSFDKETNIENLKELVEQVFIRFNIDYELEEIY